MKTKTIVWLILCCVFAGNSLFAQDRKIKKEEKVIIIHKTDDGEVIKEEIIIEDGDGTEETIIIEQIGENGEEVIIKVNGEEIEIDEDIKWISKKEVEEAIREVEVTLDDLDGENSFDIHIKDENGEDHHIQWNGDGPIPDDIQQQLDELDIQIADDISIEGEKEVIVIIEKNKKKKKKKKKNKGKSY